MCFVCKVLRHVLFDLCVLMSLCHQGGQTSCHMRSLLTTQKNFVDNVVQVMKIVMRESGSRSKKVSHSALSLVHF